MTLQTTALHPHHVRAGAKLVDFAGWHMPLHFGSITAEHAHTRAAGSIFDVSHMGRLRIEGDPEAARRFLETVLTRRVSDMAPGQVRYSPVCNADGGTLDDVLVSRFDDHWGLVVNASNRLKLLAHFADPLGGAALVDETGDTAMLAIQGPAVMPRLIAWQPALADLRRYRFTVVPAAATRMIVSRTGYTGEDGVEVIFPAAAVEPVMRLLAKVLGDDVRPAGLGARDSLRLEAGMPLYGHELDEATTPLEAGLGFAVDLTKGTGDVPRFIGQDALAHAADRPMRRLVGLTLDGRRTPRQGAPVLDGDAPIGTVTSGAMSPTVGAPIAHAYLEPGFGGERVNVQIGSGLHAAAVGPARFLS